MKIHKHIQQNYDPDSCRVFAPGSNQRLPIWPNSATQEMSLLNRNNEKKIRISRKFKKKQPNSDMDKGKQSGKNASETFETPKTMSIIEVWNSGLEQNAIKFPNDFEMLEFRNKLRGKKFITELRHFLYLMNRKSSVVTKYIEVGGKPMELAEALERIDKTNSLHISYLCQALQAVVMEIISNHPTHMDAAVSACRYFLNVNSSVIEQLLKSAQTEDRRVALKLLTAIVATDPHMSRHILTAFTMLSDVRQINLNLSHCSVENHEQETVRTCFIKFVLAFFVDGNSLLIHNLLNCRALIQALVFGLLYDDHTTVCLVLNNLNKYILENANISKSMKVRVFGLECCKRLLLLYDWVEPSVLPRKFASPSTINSEEKEVVAATVHEFLLTLLSSHTHGIAFNVSTHLRRKHNNDIQDRIIGFLQKPWNCKRRTVLILKILEACPDLTRRTMSRFSDIIKPEHTDDEELIAKSTFLRGLISTLHTDVLSNELQQIKLTDFDCWVMNTCLPFEALASLRNSNMVAHSNLECRLAIYSMLLATFSQYSKLVQYAMQREQKAGDGTTLRQLKLDLYNHILNFFPSIDNIIDSLNFITSETARIDPIAMLKNLNLILDLILVICKPNYSPLYRTSRVNILSCLHPLFEVEENSGDGVRRKSFLAEYADIQLELKIVKAIMLLDPNALERDQDFLLHVLKSFIKGFIYGSDDVKRETGHLLGAIFQNSGIFSKSTLEIDLWLEALRCCDSVTVDTLAKTLITVLRASQEEVNSPTSKKSETNKTFTMSKLLPLIFKTVEIVQPPDKYIELVCLLMFHYHPRPSYIAKLFELKFKCLPRYMRNWLSAGTYVLESKCLELPKLCDRIPHLKELQSALLTRYMDTNFETIFGSSNNEMSFEIEVEHQKYKLSKVLRNERLLMIYIQQVIFLVMQLLKKLQLMHKQTEFAAKFIVNFMAILHEMEQENNVGDISCPDEDDAVNKQTFLGRMLTYIYEIRLNFLSSLELSNTKGAQFSHYLHFLALISDYCSKLPDFLSFVRKFRLKMFKAAALKIEAVEQQSKQQSNTYLIRMIEVFQLNIENCLGLLKLICNNLNNSDFFIRTEHDLQGNFYYDLLICILKRFAELQTIVECETFVKCLANYYIYFVKNVSSEINLEDFEKVFYDFLCVMHQYIPRLDSDIFTCMFGKHEMNRSCIKLACLLLQHNNNFDEHFVSLLPYHIDKRELIFPLLEVAFNKKISMDTTLLIKIYQAYRIGIFKAIFEPQKAAAIYKEHVDCSIGLVTSCMPVTECMDFCKKRINFNDACELYQIRLIHAIYEKAWNALKNNDIDEYAGILISYLSLQIQVLNNVLKHHSPIVNKLELLTYYMNSWFTKIQELPAAADYDFEIICKSQQWMNFCRKCLQLGMRTGETNETSDIQYGLVLKFMAYLCNKFYMDYDGTTNKRSIKRTDQSELTQLFEMICTHPNYFDIVLSTKLTKIKTAVLCLLYTLAKKSPISALPCLQIPVILSAFHGKQSEADHYILALLNLCDIYNPHILQQYHPFIWRLHSMHLLKPKKLSKQKLKL